MDAGESRVRIRVYDAQRRGGDVLRRRPGHGMINAGKRRLQPADLGLQPLVGFDLLSKSFGIPGLGLRFFASILELLELALESLNLTLSVLQVLVLQCELLLQVCTTLLIVEHAADNFINDGVQYSTLDRDRRRPKM